MIFQTLDDKLHCVGFYINGDLHFGDVSSSPRALLSWQDLNATWKYAPIHSNERIEYYYLYCGGKSLTEVCPPELKPEWEKVRGQMQAYHRAFKTAKINFREHCIFDLIPDGFLKKYFGIKNDITSHVASHYERPKNYEFLDSLHRLITNISYQKLNLNVTNIQHKAKEKRCKAFLKSLPKLTTSVSYNIFGQRTGGLTGKKGFFPIMNLDRELRSVLEPNNDSFLELDYNSAHLRVMLGLCGHEQPKEDIHDWNWKTFFKDAEDRDEVKRKTFSWLYNENAVSPLETVYDKKKILDKYWYGDRIENEYGRVIPCDEHHALNYIIASTTHDLFLRKAVEIGKLLEGRKSKITALIQDSILIDFDESEEDLISEISEKFSQTIFGDFRINLRKGCNFGEMK